MACRSPERTGAQTVAKTPEQREQARAAQVAHPAASTSAHDPPRLRPCVWSCELVRRRVWSSKANRKGTHAAASCAWVSITQVVTCLHPRVLCGSGEGHVFKIYLALRLTRRIVMARHLFSPRASTGIWSSRRSCWTAAALRLMRRVQRGHDRSFRPYRLWDGVPFSGADGCTNRGQDSGAAGAGTRGTGRTSGSFDERARSATAPAVRLVVRIGTAAGLVVQGQQEGHTRGRVVCVGIDNPGSNVSPSSSPVWQWGGARF